MKKLQASLIVASLFGLLAGSANAAIDTTAATTAITDYQTAGLAVLSALLTAVVAIWGTRKVMHFFGK